MLFTYQKMRLNLVEAKETEVGIKTVGVGHNLLN